MLLQAILALIVCVFVLERGSTRNSKELCFQSAAKKMHLTSASLSPLPSKLPSTFVNTSTPLMDASADDELMLGAEWVWR